MDNLVFFSSQDRLANYSTQQIEIESFPWDQVRSNWQEVFRNTDTQCNQRVKTSKDKTDLKKR